MKTFNLTRFASLMRYQIAQRKRDLLIWPAFFAAIPLFFDLMMLAFHRQPFGHNFTSTIAQWYAPVLFLFMLTIPASIASRIATRRDRIRSFMLPATKLEKFAATYLFLVLVMPIAILVSIVAVDLVQALISWCYRGEAWSITTQLLQRLGDTFNLNILNTGSDTTLKVGVANSLLLFWLFHSLMLLFGTFFRKQPVGLSLLAMMLLVCTAFFLLTLGGYASIRLLDYIYGEGGWKVTILSDTLLQATASVTLAALIALNYWAAFRVYSRMEVAAHKWYNL